VNKTAGRDVVSYIPFERGSPVACYRQIYEGYRAAVLSGRLRPGQRLPSSRALAAELGISRLPVLTAFEQLVQEGYIEGRVGSGTYVRDGIPEGLSGAAPDSTGPTRSASGMRPRRPQADAGRSTGMLGTGLGPFRASLPALDRFPRATWARLVARHARGLPLELMAYGDPAGYEDLREAIADYLRAARAVRCDASQVLIVSGSQMALQLCAMALLGRDDVLCMEEPGYWGARDALALSGATVVPVPVDGEGIDVDRVAAVGPRARVAYVTPSHQYPLGMFMTASRRLELLRWAQRNDAWIVEDDYDSEYRYASRPLGTLQGMDEASRVIYVGTFSKVLFPALRVGYLVVPRELLESFVRVRVSLDLFAPTLYQVVLADFLREGHFARHVRRMRALYLRRRDALVESLQRHLGGVLTVEHADAGLHLSAYLADGLDDLAVVRGLEERGVFATALSKCYAGGAPRSGLILGFGAADERVTDRAVRTLARVIREAS
jgi:GntR family transcriptional regulator / MocR family aminotransferase